MTDNPIHHCFSDVETSGDNVIVAGTFAPPEQIPVPPSNLVANAISTNQINLTWQDNSDNEDGFEIIGRLEPDDDGVWSHIGIVGANTTSYSDSGLLQGATYYLVKAYNSAGDSAYSNEAWAITLDDFGVGDWVIVHSTEGLGLVIRDSPPGLKTMQCSIRNKLRREALIVIGL